MSFSNDFETRVLNYVFTASSVTRPTAWHVALYTAAPSDTGGGTEVSVEYPTATASYGTVTHVGVFDAASSGNLIAYAALTTNKAIDTGDVFRLPAGDLDITLD